MNLVQTSTWISNQKSNHRCSQYRTWEFAPLIQFLLITKLSWCYWIKIPPMWDHFERFLEYKSNDTSTSNRSKVIDNRLLTKWNKSGCLHVIPMIDKWYIQCQNVVLWVLGMENCLAHPRPRGVLRKSKIIPRWSQNPQN